MCVEYGTATRNGAMDSRHAVSDHFCGKREWFVTYKETPKNTALGATTAMSTTVKGIGDIHIRAETGGRVSVITLPQKRSPYARHAP